MATKTKKKKGDTTEDTETKVIAITSAAIKDGYCHYEYEVKSGIGKGDKHKVKGVGIIDDDMSEAFQKFCAHLACIDDVFKHNGVDIKNIDKMHNNEFTALYEVTGFKIKGEEENEQIILIGSKEVTCGGRIELETPPVPIESTSSYPWYNELKEAAEKARFEVEEYKNGKCTVEEEPEEPVTEKINFDDEHLESGKV